MKIKNITNRKNKSFEVLIDDEDEPIFDGYHIRISCKNGKLYAQGHQRGDKSSNVSLFHRVLMGPPKHMVVDHINGNTLDNRKSNLRVCTRRENLINSATKRGSSSKYKGVSWSKKDNSWRVRVHSNGLNVHLRYFKCEISAAHNYNEFAKKHFGEYAKLNVVEDE